MTRLPPPAATDPRLDRPGVMVDSPTVSVVICAYTEQRWSDLVAALASVAGQSRPAAEVILVIDHNDTLLARAASEFPTVDVVANDGTRGLSGGRNTAIERATGDLVAFLDDDAVADPDWLEILVDAFGEPGVVGAGGTAVPRWDEGRPTWFPEEFDWVVGCTHRGTPTSRADVRNVIGCNMAFRRSALESTAGFHAGLGRVGTVPLGCEETELCIRLRALDPSARVVFEPAAVVHHHVTVERRTVGYFLRRNRAEGMSKAVVASLVGASAGMATERDYAAKVLPRAALRGVGDAARGRFAGLGRTAAIVAGLGAFGLGYAQAELAHRRGRVVLSETVRATATDGDGR